MLNTPITPPRVQFLDPRTGTISREWYMFFLSLNNTVDGSSLSLDDLQKGPPVVTDNVDNDLQNGPVITIDQINAAIAEATSDPRAPEDALLEKITEIQKNIDGLESRPIPELGTLAQLQQNNVPWLQFDTSPEGMPTGSAATGSLYWVNDNGNKTLNLVMEDSGGIITQVCRSSMIHIKASSAITKGQVVMITGTVGASGAITGAPATGLTVAQAQFVVGIAAEDIVLNGWGYVSWFGELKGFDTTGGAEAWVDGQLVYLNPAVAGGLTKTAPNAPNPKVLLGAVIKAGSGGSGSMAVRPTFGKSILSDLNDAQVTSPANGNVLIYNATNSRWENATITAGSNIVVTNGAGSITVATKSVKTVQFQIAASTGDQSVTGVGFTPRSIDIIATVAASGTAYQSTGSYDGSLAAVNWIAVDSTGRYANADSGKVIKITDSASTTLTSSTFVSFDSDGFTINNATVTSRPWCIARCYP